LVAAEAVGLNRGGIGFQRNFCCVFNAPMRGNGVENALHSLRFHQAGRAAAKENRADLAPFGERGAVSDFGFESRQIALFIHRFMANMAVKVAIGAF